MKRLMLLFSLLLASPVAAQTVKTDFAVGGGFMFVGNEDLTFSADSLYGVFHWNGISLPGPELSTGIGFEFHPATIAVEGNAITNVDYRIWSLNRFNCPASLYCGADLQFAEGGQGGSKWSFDKRIVVGLGLYDGATVDVNFELYTLEDNRPISAAVLVRWGGSNQP